MFMSRAADSHDQVWMTAGYQLVCEATQLAWWTVHDNNVGLNWGRYYNSMVFKSVIVGGMSQWSEFLFVSSTRRTGVWERV